MKIKVSDAVLMLDGCDTDDLKITVIDEGDWYKSSPKSESKDIVFQYEDRYYMLSDERSGSYFTDYYCTHTDWPLNGDIECPEVQKVQKIIESWEHVVTPASPA